MACNQKTPVPYESMEAPAPFQKTAAPVPDESTGIPVPVMCYPVYGQAVAVTEQQGALPQWVRPPEVDWKYGMCLPCCIPCEDCGLCCDSFWCTYCQLSRQWAAIKDGRSDDPNWSTCLPLYCLGVVLSFFTPAGGLVPWVVGCHLRGELRKNENVTGSVFGDCYTTFCCLPCTIIQQHRELKARGVDPGYTCCSSSLVQPLPGPPSAAGAGGRRG